ncbi:Protein of unknown function [Gryllus bimaculatus]|nr:Protein of unknown function [Gryllus bimaculatus]
MPPLPPLILHVGDAIKGGELCTPAILILFGDAEASGADVMVATGEIVIMMAATSTAIAASGTARGDEKKTSMKGSANISFTAMRKDCNKFSYNFINNSYSEISLKAIVKEQALRLCQAMICGPPVDGVPRRLGVHILGVSGLFELRAMWSPLLVRRPVPKGRGRASAVRLLLASPRGILRPARASG